MATTGTRLVPGDVLVLRVVAPIPRLNLSVGATLLGQVTNNVTEETQGVILGNQVFFGRIRPISARRWKINTLSGGYHEFDDDTVTIVSLMY